MQSPISESKNYKVTFITCELNACLILLKKYTIVTIQFKPRIRFYADFMQLEINNSNMSVNLNVCICLAN